MLQQEDLISSLLTLCNTEFLWTVILTSTGQVVQQEPLDQERLLLLWIELKATNGEKLMIFLIHQYQIEKLKSSVLLKSKWIKFLIKFNSFNGSVSTIKDKKMLEMKKFKKCKLISLELSLKNNKKEESMISIKKNNKLSDMK